MHKIPTLFQRNYDTDRLVRNEVTPGTEWVLAGEGVPTRKFDGTCCLIQNGKLYRRYTCKQGNMPPLDFEIDPDCDWKDPHQEGWLPVTCAPQERWHCEAFARGVNAYGSPLHDGTYELCGPKIQGNPERFPAHVLVPHSAERIPADPRTFEEIKAFLATADIEGIVWHHPDGRMAKVKTKDFGMQRRKP